MNKKNIIIIGYPKSGTTWLSRLVAELISCPLRGDWGFETLNPPYREGTERDSDYQCFKSHHIYSDLMDASTLKFHRAIYIVRDPRDVVVSGCYYFSFLPKLLAKKNTAAKINPILRKTYNKLVSKKEKKRQMIKAVLSGNKNIDPWLGFSWKEHYNSYRNKNILIVKYEDLIDATELECLKILDHLGITQTREHILSSIENQSFQNRRLMDVDKSDSHQKKLLRKGTYGNWKKEFSKNEKSLFKDKLKKSSDLYKF